MDFNERVIPNVSANFLYKEALARYEFALKKISKKSDVLDLGCGTGYGTALIGRNHAVTGMDVDEEAITYAKKHYGEYAKFTVGDVSKTPKGEALRIQKWDVISSFEVIEHVKNPKRFLENTYALLKPHGILFLSTPNAKTPTPFNSTKSPYHVKEYTQKEFEHMLKSVFPKVEIYGQVKSTRAQKAFAKFMDSQSVRQSFVNADRLRLRKLIPRAMKEKLWKYLGAHFGRSVQEELETVDFPIRKSSLGRAEYFIAVCKK
jgi:2-polyprenyl-3-methyl-5-hydroxy-6-metoxy-1,4-benzoquinol methylase